MKEKIAIGKILKPHGVAGDFIFWSYSGLISTAITPLYLFYKGEYMPVSILKSKPYKTNKSWFLVQLKNIDRNLLDLAKGCQLFIDELPYNSLKEGEFFYKDIEGCDVFCKEDYLGKALAVHNFSGPDLVEVEYTDPIKQKTRNLFLPMKEPFLRSLDIEAKKIVFEDIDGFL